MKMCYSYKTNYKLLSKSSSFTHLVINVVCALHLLHRQHQRDSWIRPKHVWECLLSQALLQPWFCLWAHPSQRIMVEHKHVLLHIPIRKSHMVSCLGILGTNSVVPSLWVPCVQCNVEAMFHLETEELSICLGASSGIWQSYETLGYGRSRGISFIHLGFVVAEI